MARWAKAGQVVVGMVVGVGLLVAGDPSAASSTPDPGPAPFPDSVPHLLFRIPEHDLYPESIAFDPRTGDYLLGSMSRSRILRIHADGSYQDFLPGPEPMLQGSIGLKVDAARRRLWVCTGRYVMFAGDDGAPPRTGLLLFDLDTGTLRGSWLVDQPSPGQIFNDLAVAPDGSVYVTTTLFGRVYHVSADSREMELVLDTPGRQTNGITLGPEGRSLFLALDRTISRLDLETGELAEVPTPGGASLGTDGLYYHEGSLISVKPRAGQVVRLRLDPSRTAVQTVEILSGEDPSFAYPTTGVLVGDTLVFVATSYATVPRTVGRREQHPDVLIHRLPLSVARGEQTPGTASSLPTLIQRARQSPYERR